MVSGLIVSTTSTIVSRSFASQFCQPVCPALFPLLPLLGNTRGIEGAAEGAKEVAVWRDSKAGEAVAKGRGGTGGEEVEETVVTRGGTDDEELRGMDDEDEGTINMGCSDGTE